MTTIIYQSAASPVIRMPSRSFMHPETRHQPPQPVKYQQYTPIEPPAGMSYTAFLCTWTDDHVARWLSEIKCGCHEEVFKTNDIRGDILLELDQITLKEMGISSIGDRLRILNAVKVLRQRVAGKGITHKVGGGMDYDSKPDGSGSKAGSRRLENVRPAPLQLNSTPSRGDLPALIREQGPDSARSTANPPVRPLPHPTQSTPPSNNQLNTPGSSVTPGILRSNLPPLPPIPRGQPPPPPIPIRVLARNLPSRSNAHQDAPPPQNTGHLTPSGSSWVNHHLPADPRPGNPGSGKPAIMRTISPVPPARLRQNQQNPGHGRNGSVGLNSANTSSPSKTGSRTTSNTHPYANSQPALLPPPNPASNLSPIEELFVHQGSSGTPSPPAHAYTVGRGPFNPSAPTNSQYTLDDLRRKLVKFVLPDDDRSFTIDVASCSGGVEVLEKVLRKFGKGDSRSDGNTEVSHTEEGGLMVDGWGVYMDIGQDDGPGMYPCPSMPTPD